MDLCSFRGAFSLGGKVLHSTSHHHQIRQPTCSIIQWFSTGDGTAPLRGFWKGGGVFYVFVIAGSCNQLLAGMQRTVLQKEWLFYPQSTEI